jgi:hypothetical protein
MNYSISHKLMNNINNMQVLNMMNELSPGLRDRQEALFLGAVEDIAYSRTKTLELEIYNLRNTQIVSSN